MTPEKWGRVQEVFLGAVARQAGERVSFLGEACLNDDDLRSEVESLLATHELEDRFLDRPVDGLAAALLMPDGESLIG